MKKKNEIKRFFFLGILLVILLVKLDCTQQVLKRA